MGVFDELKIAIVGAGFGGVALAIALKKAGIDSFTIFEKASEAGGVWRDNAYPGAACDVPSRFYSYSFEQDYPWSQSFAPQAEIFAYLKHCIAKYKIDRHIRYDTEIAAAVFDPAARRWNFTTADGRRFNAHVFVSATGLFSRPVIPDIPGAASFLGQQFHSARWNHDLSLDGKVVAVIGTGASAIQFVPAIAPRVKQLHLFQRTPHYVMPRPEPKNAPPDGPDRKQNAFLRRFERLRIFLRFERAGRRRNSDRLTRKAELVFRKFLEHQIADAELRRKLTPNYRLGCKRLLFSNDWFATLMRPNVAVVDTPIEAIVPEGIRTADGETRAADVIIYGTGFSPTAYLAPMKIVGLEGRDLRETWRDGAEAHLGIAVAGFPNLFMLYGPNTNVAGSIIYMLECQADFIVHAVEALRRGDIAYINVREAAQRRFNEQVQRRLNATVIAQSNCHSYFRDPSGRITTQWPGSMFGYRLRTRRLRRADFEFVSAPVAPAELPLAAE